MFCSCRISTDKCLARSLCNSRVSCITSVDITDHFRKTPVVKWPSLIIKNTYLNMKFTINDCILLCPLQAFRLHRIIAGQFWCILTTRYDHCLYRVELVSTNADEIPQSRVFRSYSVQWAYLYLSETCHRAWTLNA